jgi:DNA-directed RNA polymerase subunit RPC12/RpoP
MIDRVKESSDSPRTPYTHREQTCERCGKRFLVKYLGEPKSDTVTHIGCGHVQKVQV